ncbi:MAG: cell division protein ZapA [Candidatus Aminicenantes bacterium]|jgi:cell division protein ZapA|nr:cell division protein ZapA [Candidatus Aminicenantes bacterium]
MTDRVVEIEIYGQRYKIRVKGEEDERYIGQLTAYVDQKMHEIAVKSKSSDMLKVAVLAALNIADDYFLSQREKDQLGEVIGRIETEVEGFEDRLFKNEKKYIHLDKATS